MAFTCDVLTRAELDASPNKLADAAVINAALGSTRRIICKRDDNAAAADPWATGTIFRNVGSTGALKVVGGRITGLGRIKGTTVSLAASMSTGKSVIRIQGNGRWVQGSLGLVGSNADFVVRGSFTATNGITLAANFAISGKRFKASGLGPAAPAKTAAMAHTFELQDWANPASPVTVQITTLDTQEDDFVLQDPERNADMGDIAWHRCSQSLTWGPYEFAPHLFLADKSNTETNTAHLQQVLIANAYRGTWDGYPDAANYDHKNHIMNPGPFKIVMKNQAGVVLHTFQMQDGKAINDPTIHSGRLANAANIYSGAGRDDTNPLRPQYNTYMMLPWQSERPRMSNFAKKLYPGMTQEAPFAHRPSMAKGHFSVNGAEPLLTGGGNGAQNGLNNMWGQPQWPRPYGYYMPEVVDPYLAMGNFNQDGGSAAWAPWASGWDYEPGSYSGHNWTAAPGGLRFDRGVIPSLLAMWMTYPDGNRIQENTKWRDMVNGHMLAHFNHSNKCFSDPKKLYLDTNENLLNNTWSVTNLYYGPFTNWRQKNIRVNSTIRGGLDPDAHFDNAGNLIINGWGRDPLHNYTNAAWGALLLNSPIHAIASKLDTFTSWGMDYPNLNEYNPQGDYGVRVQAWQWLVYPLAWKVAADHPLAFNKREIEDRFAALLERYWQFIWKPLKIDNDQRPFFQTLRNMGTTFSGDGGGGGGGPLGFYMGHVLQVMKQTGFWSAMMARGGHVKDVLELEIEMRDKYCFDHILDTHMMSNESYHFYHKGDFGGGVPASWADWAAKYPSESFRINQTTFHQANRTMFTDQNGNWSPLVEGATHNMLQYPSIRKHYFPEYPNPRLDATIERLRGFEQIALNAVNAETTPFGKKERDHNQRLPHLVNIAAPTELGPA